MRDAGWPTVLSVFMPTFPPLATEPFHVAIVIGAAANIAGHGGPNLVGSGMGIVIEQRFGAHQLAGGAITALRSIVFDESFLQRMRASRCAPGLPPSALYRPLTQTASWLHE